MCNRGVCDRATADCVNPATCTASANCLDGDLCVGGACVPEPEACGAAGCEGNQVCEYDAGSLSAACGENPAGCATTVDCSGERVCRAGACVEVPGCMPDAFEPNDTAAAAMGASVSASLCPGDVDVFGFDTAQSTRQQGALAVRLELNREDVGIGSPELVVVSPLGREVARVAVDAQGRAQASAPVTIVQRGVFVLRVEGVVRSPGVRYQLSAAVVEAQAVNACAQPLELTQGTSMSRSTLSGASSGLSGACVDAAGELPEDVWRLVVTQTSYVSVTARPATGVDVAVSLRATCLVGGADEVCASRAGAGGAEVVDAALEPGEYFVIVQATNAATGGSYTLQTSVMPAICTQADNFCKDANTSSACNGRGTAFLDETCDDGCDPTTRRCRRPAGDACYNAIPVGAGAPYLGTVVWSNLRDDLRMPAGACVAASGTVTPVEGPDMVFAAQVPPGHVLVADLEYSGDNISLYAVRDCAALASSCLVGVNRGSGVDEQLVWRNEAQQAATVYLVADVRADASYVNSDISVQVLPAICSPGGLSCDAGGVASQRCDAQGTSYASSVTCRAGCEPMTGACRRPPEDTCAGAVEAISGLPIVGAIQDFTANYTMTSGQSCTGFAVNGPEGVYKLSGVAAGERISVVYDVDFDGSLWLTNSCTGMGAGACLIGSDRGDPESFVYVAPSAGDYYVMAAAYSTTANGAYTLTVTRELPNCALGDGSVCSGPSTVSYCDAQNFTRELSCPVGCTAGECDQRDGNTCFSGIPLVGASGSTPGTFSGATSFVTLPAGISGGCVVRNNQASSGPDRIYTVDLNAGDLLTVGLTTTLSTAHLYILESCRDAASCAVNNPARGAGTLTYHATTSKRVYVVVDSSGATTTTYTLTHNITPNAACAPGRARCLDATSLGKCSSDGLVEQIVACGAGCEGYACKDDVATTDVCGPGTPDVGAGISILGSFAAHTGKVNMTAASCVGATTPGADVFYRAMLAPGQGISAQAESFGNENPAVYIFTDCAATVTSCKAGAARATGTQRATAFYINNTGAAQQVFVALDSEQSGADEPFSLEIGTYYPSCVPGASQCAILLDGSQGAEVCLPSGAGFGAPAACPVGCDGGTGLCVAAPGERCDVAIELVAGVAQTGDFTDFKVGSSGVCREDDNTTFTASGRRAIYRVSNVAAGEVLRASVSSSQSRDVVVWIASACDVGANLGACLLGQDDLISSTLAETVMFQAPAAGDYYVIAQAYSNTVTTGAFNVSLERLTPICVPGAVQCTTLANGSAGTQRCAANGLSYNTATACPGGCDAGTGACIAPVGDRCDIPIELTPGAQVSGSMVGFGVDYALTSSSCTGYSVSGRDVVYALRGLPANQRVRVTYTTTGYDGSVWVMNSCTNGQASACLAGRDATGGAGTETLTYTASAGGDLYIIAAAYAATGTGTFTLLAELLP
jgi:hypothetical protein